MHVEETIESTLAPRVQPVMLLLRLLWLLASRGLGCGDQVRCKRQYAMRTICLGKVHGIVGALVVLDIVQSIGGSLDLQAQAQTRKETGRSSLIVSAYSRLGAHQLELLAIELLRGVGRIVIGGSRIEEILTLQGIGSYHIIAIGAFVIGLIGTVSLGFRLPAAGQARKEAPFGVRMWRVVGLQCGMRLLRGVVRVVDEVMHIEVAIELIRTGVGDATGMHHAHGRRQHLPIGQGYEEDEQNEHDLHTYRVAPANAIDQQTVRDAEYEDARSGAGAREAAGNGTIAIKVVANDQL